MQGSIVPGRFVDRPVRHKVRRKWQPVCRPARILEAITYAIITMASEFGHPLLIIKTPEGTSRAASSSQNAEQGPARPAG